MERQRTINGWPGNSKSPSREIHRRMALALALEAIGTSRKELAALMGVTVARVGQVLRLGHERLRLQKEAEERLAAEF